MIDINKSAYRLAALLWCAWLLSACTTIQPVEPVAAPAPDAAPQADTGVVEPEPGVPAEVEPLVLDPRRRAVLALLQTADVKTQSGEFEAAVANLERALRIAPRDPLLWQRLALLRLQQGRYAQAEHLAAKANAMAGSDTAIRARNWQIIAQARDLQGNSAGARAAYQQAAEFRGR